MKSTVSRASHPDNAKMHSEYYTKKVLKRASEHPDESRYTHGACHTLAYALWLANERRGKLMACMNSLAQPDGELQSVSYGHMVYEDANGCLWDVSGPKADERYEAVRVAEHDDEMEQEERQWYAQTEDEDDDTPFEPLDIQFEWIEVHPSNLFAFLNDWGATHEIDQSEVESLTHDAMRDNGLITRTNLPGQFDIFDQTHAERDLRQPPYTLAWYRQMRRDGWISYDQMTEQTQLKMFCEPE